MLVGGKLWYNVMVIGVKPFGHFHGGDIQAILLIAPCHGEVQVDLGIGLDFGEYFGVPFRDNTQHQRSIQYLVVITEIVTGDEVDTSLLLQLPVLLADAAGCGKQLVPAGFALPVLLTGFFEFTIGPYARVAEVVFKHTHKTCLVKH